MMDIDEFINNPMSQVKTLTRKRPRVDAALDPSVLKQIGNVGVSGLSMLGNVIDLPVSSVRDVLHGGENPFDQWMPGNWTTSENRKSMRQVLRKHKLISDRDTPENWLASTALDSGLDPTTYLGSGLLFRGAGALTKGGKVARAAGLLDDATKLVSKGPREANQLASLGELVSGAKKQPAIGQWAKDMGLPEGSMGYAEGAATNIAEGTSRAKRAAAAAKGHGYDLADIENMPLGGLVAPLGPFRPLAGPTGVWGKAGGVGQKIAHGLDVAGKAISESAPVRAGSMLFEHATRGLYDKEAQKLARTATPAENAAAAGASMEAMKLTDELEAAKKPLYGTPDVPPGAAPQPPTPPGQTPSGPTTLFQSGKAAAPEMPRTGPWHKMSRKLVEQLPDAPIKTKDLKGFLQNKGVKADEFEYTGLGDLLSTDATVTKQQALDAIDTGIGVKEVVRGGDDAVAKVLATHNLPDSEGDVQWMRDALARLRQGGSDGSDAKMDIWNRLRTHKLSDAQIDQFLKDAGRSIARHAQHTVPGGSNYRELLVTLERPKGSQTEDYISPSLHWGNANILASIRTKDRIGRDGKKTLFIEEIQSDWHQAGQKSGYKKGLKQENFSTWSAREHGLSKEQANALFNTDSDIFRDWRSAQDAAQKDFTAPPDAPFKKNWHELAMKRATQWASENGYDRVAWTKGEVHAKRWHQEKHIGGATLDLDDVEKGVGTLYLHPPGQNGAKPTQMESLDVKYNVTRPDVEKILGKEASDRLFERASKPDSPADLQLKVLQDLQNGRLDVQSAKEILDQGSYGHVGVADDLNLKIGGERMKRHYDEDLVKAANKLGKKYGATVSEVDLPDVGKAWGFDVTPSMRESAVKQGQPLFQGKKGGMPGDYAQVQDSKIYDTMTGKTLREALQKTSPKDADHVFALIEARASAFGEKTDDYVARKFAGVSKSTAEAFPGAVAAGAKGAVEFLEDGRAIIHAFEGANLSTMAHEVGHVFRRDLSPEDLAKAEAWAGVAKGAAWSDDAEEKFARGFERYLQTGKAPTAALADIFKKFKTWLTNIYQVLVNGKRTIKGSEIDFKLPPEMKQVYDNLFTPATGSKTPASAKLAGVLPSADEVLAAQITSQSKKASLSGDIQEMLNAGMPTRQIAAKLNIDDDIVDAVKSGKSIEEVAATATPGAPVAPAIPAARGLGSRIKRKVELTPVEQAAQVIPPKAAQPAAVMPPEVAVPQRKTTAQIVQEALDSTAPERKAVPSPSEYEDHLRKIGRSEAEIQNALTGTGSKYVGPQGSAAPPAAATPPVAPPAAATPVTPPAGPVTPVVPPAGTVPPGGSGSPPAGAAVPSPTPRPEPVTPFSEAAIAARQRKVVGPSADFERNLPASATPAQRQAARKSTQAAMDSFMALDKAEIVSKAADDVARAIGELSTSDRKPGEAIQKALEMLDIKGVDPTTLEGVEKAVTKIREWNKTAIHTANAKGAGVEILGDEAGDPIQHLARYGSANLNYQEQQELQAKLTEALVTAGKSPTKLNAKGERVSMTTAEMEKALPKEHAKQIRDEIRGSGKYKIIGGTAVDQARQHETRTVPTRVIEDMLEDKTLRLKPGMDEGQRDAAGHIFEKYAQYLDPNYEARSKADVAYGLAKWAEKNQGRPGFAKMMEERAKMFGTPEANSRAMQHAWELAEHMRVSASRERYTRGLVADQIKYAPAVMRKNALMDVVHHYLRQSVSNAPGAGSVPIETVFREARMDHEKAIEWFAKQGGMSVAEAGRVRIPKDAAAAVASVVRTQPGSIWGQKLGETIDFLNNITRQHLTIPFPAFHFRNWTSGQYVNLVTALETPQDYREYADAYRQSIALPRSAKAAKTEADILLWRELESYRVLGQASGQRGAARVGMEDVAYLGQNPLPGVVERTPGLKQAGQAYQGAMRLGEHAMETAEFYNRVPLYLYYKNKGYSPLQAALEVKKRHFDYQELTDFERNVMRRGMLFYSYTRKMAPLMAETLMQRPGGALAQTIRAAGKLHDTESQPIPEYIKETAAIPLKPGAKGNLRYLTGLGLPFEDMAGFGASPVNELLSRTTPLIKAPVEMSTGTSLFQRGRPLEELDPNIGRLSSNIRELTTGQKVRTRAKPFLGSPALEFIAANSPASRILSSARTLSDPRKSLLDKVINLGTGVKITDISPASQETEINKAIAKQEDKLGAREYTVNYVPKEVKAGMTPEQLVELSKLEGLRKANAALRKKRLAEEAKR